MNTSITQPELSYAQQPSATPSPAAPAEVAALVAFLRGRGWMFARDIIAAKPPGVGLPDGMEAAKRRLRVLVKASDAAIISAPGSPGYCLFDETTEAEIDRILKARYSQIGEEQNDVTAILRRHHQRHLVHNNEVSAPAAGCGGPMG